MPIDFYQSAFCVLGIDDLKFKIALTKKTIPIGDCLQLVVNN